MATYTPDPRVPRYVRLTLDEARMLEEYWRRNVELIGEFYSYGLGDILQRAAAAGMPFDSRSEFSSCQDMVVFHTRQAIRGAFQNQRLLEDGIAAQMKRECGVQLDPTHVRTSVRALLKDIRNQLPD